jgi:hypothetical protein
MTTTAGVAGRFSMLGDGLGRVGSSALVTIDSDRSAGRFVPRDPRKASEHWRRGRHGPVQPPRCCCRWLLMHPAPARNQSRGSFADVGGAVGARSCIRLSPGFKAATAQGSGQARYTRQAHKAGQSGEVAPIRRSARPVGPGKLEFGSADGLVRMRFVSFTAKGRRGLRHCVLAVFDMERCLHIVDEKSVDWHRGLRCF